MSVAELLRLLRRGWIIIVAAILVGLSAATAVSLLQKPTYESTGQAFVSIRQASDISDLTAGGSFAQQIVKSYVTVVSSSIVLDSVIQQLNLSASTSALARRVSATAPQDQAVITVTAEADSAPEAARIVNAVLRRLAAVSAILTPSQDSANGAVRITPIQYGAVPTQPASPNLPVNVVIGGMLGILFGVAAVLLRNRLDRRVRHAVDASEIASAPVLATIAFNEAYRRHAVAVEEGSHLLGAEQYRRLRTNLQYVSLGSTAKSVVVTSSLSGEGKSTTAINLAVALSAAGSQVLLIDADLRRPSVADYLGLDGQLGLTDVLARQVDLSEATQDWGGGALDVLPAGSIPPNPSELLSSGEMTSLLTRSADHYDFVIIDAPPVLPVIDACVLAPLVSTSIVVCGLGLVTREQLQATKEALHAVGANVGGLVATMARAEETSSYGYSYEPYGPSAA